jgi:hypothetical protein
MKTESTVSHAFTKSVLLGDKTPAMIRFAVPADASLLADIERFIFIAEHAASLETI